ncbi:hypothetical protein CR152_27785 [Massilia violaceinigra]|uniref:DUF1376 domain-containing protein n=1 Tax=Massilia violaceinigra TaxID=2045208 RepID=A0A2D2DSC9_9BURK|nr:YdaU family protein [Massilia violaceinigra]ATQ77879.1 hypothetical protein CR152_27785 [Massilia violaceinigra]
MNYYPFHIGDFRSGTVNMTRQARWIYRDMLDVYYDAEAPLTLDLDVLCDQIGAESDEERRIVERLLRFKFVKTEAGYTHEICERVIAEYHKKADTAKTNGKAGGRPRKATGNPKEPSGFPSGSDPVATGNQEQTGSQANQEPRTNNQEPEQATAHAIDGSAVPDFDPPKAAPLPMRELPPVSEDPAVQLAVALRRQGITANSVHPAVQGWAAKGVTVDLLTEAVAIARGSKPDGAIPVNYLAPIVNDLLNPPAARPALPRGTPPRPTNGKFHFGDIDRSGDVAAMAANMQRRGITVPEGDEVIEL